MSPHDKPYGNGEKSSVKRVYSEGSVVGRQRYRSGRPSMHHAVAHASLRAPLLLRFFECRDLYKQP